MPVSVKKISRYITALYILVFMLLPLLSVAQDGYEIRKIKFKGNKTLKKAALVEYLTINEFSLIKKIQKKTPSVYNHEFMDTDIARLVNFYQSKGFLYANIKVDSLDIDHKKKIVNIHILVQENNPVKVDSVSIKITDPPSDIRKNFERRATRRLSLTNGQQFADPMLYNDISVLNNMVTNRGYVYAKTDYKLNLKSHDTTDIAYTITLGNICQFGETTIVGNRNIREKVIRKQLTYKEGQTFKNDELEKTRKNIYDLQLFRVVSPTPLTDRATSVTPIPIKLKIEEMPRWATRFGVGWGTEDKFRAFADITYRGVFGGTSRINLNAKHSALIPYYASLSWTQPQFAIQKLSVSINSYIQRKNEPGYNTQTIGLKFPASYNINKKTTTALSYYFEKVTQQIDSFNVEVPNPEDTQFLYSKSGIAGNIAYNNSSPLYSPVKGFVISAGGKINGYFFRGDFSYSKLWIDIRKYQKIGDFVIGLRAMAGGIHSADSAGFIPVEDRFYTGGGNTNRGWARSMLGPLRDDGTPMGGKSILEMNVEIRYPLFWKIEIAAFADISNVWKDSYKYGFNSLGYAAGGGIRIDTPIGPVRFDVGVPIRNEKKSVQIFISVGQAF